MRAKVASHSGGHAFEERFLKLDLTQLIILYKHAINEDNQKKKDSADVINTVNKIWFKKLDNLFEVLQMFTNVELFKHKLEMEKVKDLREEITEENFDEVWDDIMSTVPQEYTVDEGDAMEDYLENQPADPEMDAMLAGWIQSRRGD